MRARLIRLIIVLACLCSLQSCMIEIREQQPRWGFTLKCNGVSQSYECVSVTTPVSMEYSVPEFFYKEDGTVIFRFYYKDTDFKIQAANNGPFKYGQRYDYKAGDDFFDVSFGWLYDGKEYECRSGWIEFKKALTIREAYRISFEFDLTAPGSDKLEIRNGVFTVYDKVEPRNNKAGLSNR